MKNILFIFILSFPLFCRAQDEVSTEKKRPIESALLKHDFNSFESLFHKMYAVPDTSTVKKRQLYANDLFAFAEVLSLRKKYDSAVIILKGLIKMREFDSYDGVLGSVAFFNIKKDPEFNKIAEIAYSRLLKKYAAYKNPSLYAQLMVMSVTDQSNLYYNRKDTAALHQTTKELVDSLGQIFNDNGYPKPSEVDKEASIVPALILLHADIETQLKYRDFIYNSARLGYVPGGLAGVLIDKIQVYQKKTQLYGSQYRVVGKNRHVVYYPIEDSANLEERRAQMGFIMPFESEKHMREMEYEDQSDKKINLPDKSSTVQNKKSHEHHSINKTGETLFADDFSTERIGEFPMKWKMVLDCYDSFDKRFEKPYEAKDKWRVIADDGDMVVEAVSSYLDITPASTLDLRLIDSFQIDLDFTLNNINNPYSHVKVQFDQGCSILERKKQ